MWPFQVAAPAEVLEVVPKILSPDELARAARIRFGGGRNAFVLARGVLRSLLAMYLGSRPERIEFAYGAFGKPSLSPATPRLRFNLAPPQAVR